MIVLGLILLTVLCVIAAGRVAGAKARSQQAWMIAAALLGPLPLPILLALPRRNQA